MQEVVRRDGRVLSGNQSGREHWNHVAGRRNGSPREAGEPGGSVESNMGAKKVATS